MNVELRQSSTIDVCIVVEGCYPYVSGGVSSWLDWLIRSQPDLSFGVVALAADERARKPAYAAPPNVRFLQQLPLNPALAKPPLSQPILDVDDLVDTMCDVLAKGDAKAFAHLVALVQQPVRHRPFGWARAPAKPTRGEFLGSAAGWHALVRSYERLTPHASFPDFFWAWRNLVGSLLAVLTAPIPDARIYHAISTGYAGLYAGRAALHTGRPAAITEHGIYTNERRIDLVMADWIADMIQTGMGGADERTDVRDFWITAFESFARIAYGTATHITTLYSENQTMQRPLGAAESRLRVIPNGIDLQKFANLPAPGKKFRPTAALIGRVVPIKDIEAFIAAAIVIRRAIPDAEILIIGPTDEDEAYFELCRRQVAEFDLGQTIRFTGKVNILDFMPRIDVLVLTSISEAQPLVLLEAGAAGIPCVATDVGSCREIIEGSSDESPRLGPGGIVVPAMDSQAIGEAVVRLLGDKALRVQYGQTLRCRVQNSFTSEVSARKYRELYSEMLSP